MKKIVLQLIATQVNPKDVADLRKLFQTIDVDGNGSLTLQELQRGLQSLEGGPDLIIKIMEADLDNSGELSYTEFLTATLSEDIYMREDYFDAAFKMLDKDNSGKIDLNEMLSIIGSGDSKKEKAVAQAIHEIDENGDGEISYQEFMMMMAKGTDVEERLKKSL
jgi:calcium-dependent protein kinase